jgi:hypothetical protein
MRISKSLAPGFARSDGDDSEPADDKDDADEALLVPDSQPVSGRAETGEWIGNTTTEVSGRLPTAC